MWFDVKSNNHKTGVFQCTFKEFNGGQVEDIQGERFPMLCRTVTKTSMTICGCSGDKDVVIKQRAALSGWGAGGQEFRNKF